MATECRIYSPLEMCNGDARIIVGQLAIIYFGNRYLADHLITSSDVASRLRLRSANRHQLIVPRCRFNTYGRRAFSIAGPTVWNSLPDELRDPACSLNSFLQQSRVISTSVTSALEVYLNEVLYI